jgi:hypothetical protein
VLGLEDVNRYREAHGLPLLHPKPAKVVQRVVNRKLALQQHIARYGVDALLSEDECRKSPLSRLLIELGKLVLAEERDPTAEPYQTPDWRALQYDSASPAWRPLYLWPDDVLRLERPFPTEVKREGLRPTKGRVKEARYNKPTGRQLHC